MLIHMSIPLVYAALRDKQWLEHESRCGAYDVVKRYQIPNKWAVPSKPSYINSQGSTRLPIAMAEDFRRYY